jgi:hypothetical protein
LFIRFGICQSLKLTRFSFFPDPPADILKGDANPNVDPLISPDSPANK